MPALHILSQTPCISLSALACGLSFSTWTSRPHTKAPDSPVLPPTLLSSLPKEAPETHSPPATSSNTAGSKNTRAAWATLSTLHTSGAHSVVLGVFHPLVCLHTSLTQRLGALHTIAGGGGVILTAGTALLGKGRVRKLPPNRSAFTSQKT